MVSIEGEVTIARPPEAVFDFVADERNEPLFNPQMLRAEQLTPGPIGTGTRFQAKVTSRGRPLEMVIEFTEYERPRRLSSVTRMPAMDIRGTLTFEPVPEGTRMRWHWELAPRGLVRLLTPLVARIGRRQEEAIWAGLKQYFEAQDSLLASRIPHPQGVEQAQLQAPLSASDRVPKASPEDVSP
jgi:uncharacterized protein YndB with AHSA1/START domain